MKLQQKLFIIFAICFAFQISISAQVTVGSAYEPLEGAILQLKEDNNPEENSKKGICMPRVKILSETIPTGETLAQTIEGNGSGENWDKNLHTGLIVYHTDQCKLKGKGLYAWDGNRWQFAGDEQALAPEVYRYTDPRDGEVYLARNFGNTAGDWMLENLRYVPKNADGYNDYIHTADSGLSLSYHPKGYSYAEAAGHYDPDEHPSAEWNKKKKNGLFYSWFAAVNTGTGGGLETPAPGTDQGQDGTDPITTPIRGICPQNWHLPSDKEWNDLEKEIATSPEKYSIYTSAADIDVPWDDAWATTTGTRGTAGNNYGQAFKSQCPPLGSVYTGKLYAKGLAAKDGGFDLLAVGGASGNSVKFLGSTSYVWTSSSKDADSAWCRHIGAGQIAGFGRSSYPNRNSYSVRCKKD